MPEEVKNKNYKFFVFLGKKKNQNKKSNENLQKKEKLKSNYKKKKNIINQLMNLSKKKN